MIPFGWTFEKGENIRRIEEAEQSLSEKRARKLLEDVPADWHLYDAKEFSRSADHALRRQDVDCETAKYEEGCRGDFLIKRTRATQAQRI